MLRARRLGCRWRVGGPVTPSNRVDGSVYGGLRQLGVGSTTVITLNSDLVLTRSYSCSNSNSSKQCCCLSCRTHTLLRNGNPQSLLRCNRSRSSALCMFPAQRYFAAHSGGHKQDEAAEKTSKGPKKLYEDASKWVGKKVDQPKTALSERLTRGMNAVGRGIKLTFMAPIYAIQDPAAAKVWLQNLWVKVKAECIHYWDGTKLLCAEIALSARLVKKLATTGQLTRRERKQLVKTSADLFRVVPFSVFVIVPLMEFTLPIFLKIFPNMLPSTFTSKHEQEENLRRDLQARLELAEFLQDTVDTMVHQQLKRTELAKDKLQSAESLAALLQKVKEGKHVDNEEILAVAKMFDDEMALDNLSRQQLVLMCKFLNLRPFGTDVILRYQLKRKLRLIREDDLDIQSEGLESLTLDELRAACADRGMRTLGLTKYGLRRNLQQWVDLHLNQKVPASLLILSRAFAINENYMAVPEEDIQRVISALPTPAIQEALVNVGAADPQQKLDALKKQSQLIQQESAELELRARAETKEKLSTSKTQTETQTQTQAQAQPQTETQTQKQTPKPTDTSSAPQPQVDAKQAAVEAEKLLPKIAEELSSFADTSALQDEKDMLKELKAKAEEDLQEIKETGGVQETVKERATAERLGRAVSGMLGNIEKKLERADSAIGEKLHLLDRDNDGWVSTEEVAYALKNIKLNPLVAELVLKRLHEYVRDTRGGKIPVGELKQFAKQFETMESTAEESLATGETAPQLERDRVEKEKTQLPENK